MEISMEATAIGDDSPPSTPPTPSRRGDSAAWVTPRAVAVDVEPPHSPPLTADAATPPALPPPSRPQVSRQRASRRTTRQSIREFVREPRQALQRLRPQSAAARVSVAAARQRASFRRKLLRANTSQLATHEELPLKLGSFRSGEVATLVFIAKLIMSLGPLVQLVWTVFIEPDSPAPSSLETFNVSNNDAAEATIQLLVVLASVAFLRQTGRHRRETRRPMQRVLAHLVALAAVVSALTFAADLLKSHRPSAQRGRRLLSLANALLAASLYLTLSCLTDHFAETLLASPREAFQHARQERLLRHSRRLSFALNAGTGFYLAVRLALTWRSDVVLDFIPAANVITPLRVRFFERKELEARHVFVDALVVSAWDALLLALALAKCFFTHGLFNHVFIGDFARRYTEFRVFVISFRNTVLAVTVSGHVAAWAVPFYHTVGPADLGRTRLPLAAVGSVQMQLGFRLSLALWLLSAIYCALPADTHILPPAWRLTNHTKTQQRKVAVKYFLSPAEALQRTAYRNLRHVGHADASEFVLETQIEAFNFSQLAYARGNAHYDQELDALQALVGDSTFAVVEVVHNAETDTHCVVLASESKIVVTFRGTSSKTNARTDLQSAMTLHLVAKQLDLAKVPSVRPLAASTAALTPADTARSLWHRVLCKRHDPKVHSGFYAAYLSVADRVLDRVASLYASEARPILATGHSLGGALAALCAFDLVARRQISNVACTTFGCPRVGNHAFQKRHARVVPATFAFVNASDMVTKLPPKTPKAQSYAAVGKVVLVNALGNLVVEPSELELDVMHRGYSPRAHTMRAYQLALLRWCLRAHGGGGNSGTGGVGAAYHPRFWRQSLVFLRAEYGHLLDVRTYLESSTLLHHPARGAAETRSSGEPTPTPTATRAQLRRIAKRLEAALLEEREDREDDAIARSLAAQLRQWLAARWSRDARAWYATDAAVRVLRAQLQLESDAAALGVAQLLAVQGLVEPERVVFARHARFRFPLEDAEEEELEEAEETEVTEAPLRLGSLA